ncbi:hypothetical protein BaRGS_00002917 [Batillaria attramentaria]|uniref:C-type lectin domain-containing protein n=1 Tax=Batillaria attramentaria TaxID=370345 RepID=A0ABD0M1M4_9CAEN
MANTKEYFLMAAWLSVASATTAFSTTSWLRHPRTMTTDVSSAMSVPAVSTAACSDACGRLEDCFRFCFNVITAKCYVTGLVTSPVPDGDTEASMECYVRADCPTARGYSMYSGRCLRLMSTSMTYWDARDRCAADGAHLYHYKSLVKDRQPAVDLMAGSRYLLWVGADDLVTEGTFVWSDGSLLPTDSEVWASWDDQPNNLDDTQHCASLRTRVYELYDNTCSDMQKFVCQVDVF